MKNKQKYINALIAMVVTSAVFGIGSLIMPITYQVCDDRFLMQFASGQYLGKPTEYMMFVFFPLSYVFKILYKLNNSVDWYGTIMICCHWFALTVIMYKVFEKVQNVCNRVLIAFFCYGTIITLWFTQMVCLTYTTSAAILGIAALVWYALNEHKVIDDVFCIILMILCYSIRYEAFYMIVPFAGVIWLYDFIVSKKKKSRLAFVVSLGVGLFLVIIFNNSMYGSEQWVNHFKYNSHRIQFYDYYHPGILDKEDFQDELERIGIDDTRKKIIYAYDLTLVPELKQQMIEIADSYVDNTSINERLKAAFSTVVNEVILENKVAILLNLILWGVAFLLILKCKDKLRMAFALVSILLQIGLWFYLGYKGRILPRVSKSMLYMFALFALLCVYYVYQDNKDKIIWNKKCTMVMLGLVIIVCGTSLLAVNSQRKINNNTVTRTAYYDVESYCNSHPNNFYFTDVYSITNYEGGYRYQFFNDNTYMNFVSLGDWQGFTPLFWEKLKNRGIDDVQNAIYEKDNVFVIASEDRNVDFISELKDNVECNVVDTIETQQGVKYLVYSYSLPEE